MTKQLLFLLCFLSITICQSQTLDDGVFKYTVTDVANNYVSVKKFNNAACPNGSLAIPETFDDKGTVYYVTSIATQAFKNCNNLTSVTMGSNIISIENEAFANCTNLTSVSIGSNVTNIGNQTFENCENLVGVVIPNSVINIGGSAFNACASLTSIIIPDNVISIGDYAFELCTSLSSATIGNGVTSMGEYIFSECTSLTSVSIGNSVSSIGDFAFSDCTNLNSVTVNWPTPLAINSNVFNNVTIGTIPLTVPEGTVTVYLAADVWKNFIVVEETLSTLNFNTTIGLQVYPNPVENQLHIVLNQGIELEQVNLYNNLGQLVKQSKVLITDVSELNKGLYILEIATNRGKSIKKIEPIPITDNFIY